MRWSVGTSGFSYDEWVGPFYPTDLSGAKRLAYYAERLPAVEINNTFYRMPRAHVLAGWASRVPASFRFALKAPRSITHAKEPDFARAVPHLFAMADALGDRLGPVLFQLPPTAQKDVAKLRALLAQVPAERRVALEFRHASWLDDEVFAALRDANAALCAADFDDEAKRVPLVATADFGYVRLRADAYDDAQLRDWASALTTRGWREVFVFFKHEDAGVAPQLATRLLRIAGVPAPELPERFGPRRVPAPKKAPARAEPTKVAKRDSPLSPS
jgi:uncharacterized protein YecE (DUF72 family)